MPPGSLLQFGERYGVELQMDVTAGAFANGQMEIDTAAHNSYAIPALTILIPTATATATQSATPTLTITPGGPTLTATRTFTITSTPTATNTPLPAAYAHAATLTVGSTTYDTLSAAGPSGTLTELTAGLSTSGLQNIADGSGRSLFVSGAVPAGQSWDLSGTWSFTAYTRASATGGSGYLQATIFRVDSNGAAYALATSNPASTNALFSTTAVPSSWTLMVPSGTTIAPGDRWAVQFQLNVTSAVVFGTAYLGVDTAASSTRVNAVATVVPFTPTPTVTSTITPGGPTLTSTSTPTITSTPVPAYNLHNTNVSVSGTNYNTVSTTGPTGTLATLSASLTNSGIVTLADSGGVSIFDVRPSLPEA